MMTPPGDQIDRLSSPLQQQFWRQMF